MPDLPCDWSLLGEAPLAVAVSGGADSFALLHAVSERGLPVTALTVDHSLREGSAEDARTVAAWCEARGIPHETLSWTGDKPATGIQDAARTARYRLLCEACERLGLDRLATGHTQGDQAETVFMRLRRGAGRGLAGMPPSRRIASGPGEPVTLLRPLLGARRAQARAYAEAAGLPVRDDPSNEDEGFERVRVRALLGALEEQGLLTAEALGRTAAEASTARRRDFAALTMLASDTGLRFPLGGATFQTVEFDEPHSPEHESVLVPAEGHEPAWQNLCAQFGEDFEGALREGEASGLLHRKRRFEDEGVAYTNTAALPLAAALTTAVVKAIGSGTRPNDSQVSYPDRAEKYVVANVCVERNTHRIEVYREPAALLGRADGTPGLAPVPAPPGSRHLYDRRFIVHVPDDILPGTELRPLGQLVPRDLATSTLARSRVATLPCLARGDRVTHLPAAAIRAVRDAFAGWQRAGEVLPSSLGTFEARSLLAERFANEVIRY